MAAEKRTGVLANAVGPLCLAGILLLAGVLFGCANGPGGGTVTVTMAPRETAGALSAATTMGTGTAPGAGAAAEALVATPRPSLSPTRRPSSTPVVTESRPEATTRAAATERATATPPPATATPVYVVHTVTAGQTLSEIAFVYGLPLNVLAGANELSDPNQLQEGQALRIPLAAVTPVGRPTRDYGYDILGFSIEGRAIEAFSFGDGPNDVVFVGGIHGGYEWNTVLLAYEMIDYLNGNREAIPETVTVHVVPAANPDGLHQVTGRDGRFAAELVGATPRAARFNGRGVDLNRNWSCGWSESARWGGTAVDPGSAPFSEPETRALRDYFARLAPRSVIFWHSAFGLVAPGQCGDAAGSAALAQLYGEAAGYPVGAFTAYALSGTASDWLSERGIPAAAVELTTHESTEFGRNLAGVLAVLELTAEEGDQRFGEPPAGD